MRLLHERTVASETVDAEALIREARRLRRRRWMIGVGLFVAVALVASAVTYGVGGFPGEAPRHARPGPAVSSPLAAGDKGVVTIHVAGLFGTRSDPPVGLVIAFGAGSTWVLGGPGIVRLAGETGRVQARIKITGFPQNLAFAAGDLWVESLVIGTRGYLLSEIDPATDRLSRRVVVDGGRHGTLQQTALGNFQTLAAEGRLLYLETGDGLFTVDASSGRVFSARDTSNNRPMPLFASIGGVDRTVLVRGALAKLRVPIEDATVLGADIWATPIDPAGAGSYTLEEYNERTGTRLAVSTPNIYLVAAGARQLWGTEVRLSARVPRQTLVRIDPSNGRIERRIVVHTAPSPHPVAHSFFHAALAIGHGTVWLVEPDFNTLYRVAL